MANIVVTATVLHGNGMTNIQTAVDAARVLQPLAPTFPNSGSIAQTLFTSGIIGLGLLTVPVLAGSASYAVSESLQWVEGLEMIEATFTCSDLRGARLTGAHVLGANVSRAVLNYARFTEAITSDEHLRAVKSRLGR